MNSDGGGNWSDWSRGGGCCCCSLTGLNSTIDGCCGGKLLEELGDDDRDREEEESSPENVTDGDCWLKIPRFVGFFEERLVDELEFVTFTDLSFRGMFFLSAGCFCSTTRSSV